MNRYDGSCSGEVDYNDFVEKVMESDFKKIVPSQKQALETMISSAFGGENNVEGGGHGADDDDSDMDEEDREMFVRSEIKRLFNIVDEDSSGFIDKKEVEALLHTLGRQFSGEALHEGFKAVDANNSGQIDFEEFYTWYKTVGS